MKGSEFVDLSRELLARHEEAADRAAVALSYFALMNSGRQWLIERGWSFSRTEPIHRSVFVRLYHSQSPTLRIVARDLHELRVQRLDALYNLNRKYPAASAADQVGKASAAIAMIEAIDPSEFAAIVAAIRAHEKK